VGFGLAVKVALGITGGARLVSIGRVAVPPPVKGTSDAVFSSWVGEGSFSLTKAVRVAWVDTFVDLASVPAGIGCAGVPVGCPGLHPMTSIISIRISIVKKDFIALIISLLEVSGKDIGVTQLMRKFGGVWLGSAQPNTPSCQLRNY
jgi:hypothetical protein